MTAIPALEVRGLCKAFGAIAVTDDVSLSLAPGARHALIGPNGAGKSTLVNLLSGLLTADAGQVFLFGEDVTGASTVRRCQRGLARTFQISSLFTSLSVLENVFIAVSQQRGAGTSLWGAAGARRDLLERAEEVIVDLGLAQDIGHPVATLAYGKQRLVDLAIGLALKPRVLLLDEPAAGVPGSGVDTLMRAIDRLPADMAVLLIEHDMGIVRRFAREVTVLVQGRTLMTGKPDDVMSSDEVRGAYLGKSGVKRFESAASHA
jgi:branched-chain amino acid transport system ATP-binding protein